MPMGRSTINVETTLSARGASDLSDPHTAIAQQRRDQLTHRQVREVRTAGRRETQAVRKEKVPATTPSRQPQVVIPRPPAPGARVTTYENEWQLVDRSPKRARPEEGPSNSPIHTPGRNPPRRANKGLKKPSHLPTLK
ncbi:uncharacterized protein EAF01_003741 [Botrytis porri]|uniref:uncharacterized protein n=1 Tax=Botrytis porri TaxID=87229 RepID=UPI0018FF32AE|nr:uncharacterized protein EAF01_003741 [Botrytis porri]KAF7910023.1 hypothetical protein EAF01_003741 [Botrytis porri]